MFALSLESFLQVILVGKCTPILILLLDHLQHAIKEHARLPQALHEQAGLGLIRIKTIPKGSHVDILMLFIRVVKRQGDTLPSSSPRCGSPAPNKERLFHWRYSSPRRRRHSSS
jgi:hypothetical protein